MYYIDMIRSIITSKSFNTIYSTDKKINVYNSSINVTNLHSNRKRHKRSIYKYQNTVTGHFKFNEYPHYNDNISYISSNTNKSDSTYAPSTINSEYTNGILIINITSKVI